MLKPQSALFVLRQSRIMINPSHYREKTNTDDSHLRMISVDNCSSHSIQPTEHFDNDINSLAVGGVVVLFSSFLPDSLLSPQYHCQHIYKALS